MKRDWLQVLTNFGVIFGLVALVYEIRQSEQHAIANIVDSGFHLTSANLNTIMGENPSVVFAKALTNPDELTIEDKMVLGAHHKQLLFEMELYATMADLGIYEGDDFWHQIVKSIARGLAYPKGREFWTEHRDTAQPMIRDLVDEAINENPNALVERYTK